jgi:hypothetical protein
MPAVFGKQIGSYGSVQLLGAGSGTACCVQVKPSEEVQAARDEGSAPTATNWPLSAITAATSPSNACSDHTTLRLSATGLSDAEGDGSVESDKVDVAGDPDPTPVAVGAHALVHKAITIVRPITRVMGRSMAHVPCGATAD